MSWSIWDDTGRIVDNLSEDEARKWLREQKDSSRSDEYYAESLDGATIESFDGPII